jgi:hypothetical protein
MELTIETLQELLVQAGLNSGSAAALRPDVPLSSQGVGEAVIAVFADSLASRFGAPVGDAAAFGGRSLDGVVAFLGETVDDETGKRAALARIKADWRDVPPGQSYELDRLRPEDAPGVAQLFSVIYGDKYPVVDYYVPERLIELNRQGKVLTVVARLSSGAIAGQIAYYQSSPPNKAVFEQGQLLVVPEYRNSSMAFRLLQQVDALSRTMHQAEAFFGEAVCTHLVTQKSVSRQDFSECGLELALMPVGAYEKEGAGSERVSCLLAARVDRDRHMPLFLPECYRRELELILSGFRLDRDIRFSDDDRPAAQTSRLESRTFDFANVVRVQVATIGCDFPEHLEALAENVRREGLAVAQVYLNTGEPGVAFAVGALRAQGFIFGGLLPRWFKSDGIMLQKLYVTPDFEAVNLFSDRAKALFSHIRADWDRSRSQG